MQKRDGSVELDFADGTYSFRLGWGGLEKVQEACDAGPYIILNRLFEGEWKTNDVREVIRWGLLGGGNPMDIVRKLVRDYVEERPANENIKVALAVMTAALIGAPEEEDGKKQGAANGKVTESPTFQTEKSALPQFTAPVQ